MVTVSPMRTPAELDHVRAMFDEYAAWIGVDLSFQDFARERAALPGDYVPPRGTLSLARDGERVIGMVAMRPLEAEVCEMKRLFLREAARGRGAGRTLVAGVIEAARAAGYARMRLDTLPMMDAAIALYRAAGFGEIAPYRHNPIPGALYFELDLARAATTSSSREER